MSNFVQELPCRRSIVRYRLRMVSQPSLDLIVLRAPTNRALVGAPFVQKGSMRRRARTPRLRLFRSVFRPAKGIVPKGPVR